MSLYGHLSSSSLFFVLTMGYASGSITCPSQASAFDRTFTMASVVRCEYLNGVNPGVSDVAAAYGGTWTQKGELTAAGSNDLLTITLTSGGFGSGDASGTWAISSSFWNTYGQAVISTHVGQGQGDPDAWMFLITPGELSGTWSYDIRTGGGEAVFPILNCGVAARPLTSRSLRHLYYSLSPLARLPWVQDASSSNLNRLILGQGSFAENRQPSFYAIVYPFSQEKMAAELALETFLALRYVM